jgi:hypothetical protein
LHEVGEKYNISVGKPEGKKYSEDISVDRRVILNGS